MKLRDLMQLDLGALARGRVVVQPYPPASSRWKRLFPNGFRRRNPARELILATEQLRQLVACRAPLAEGLKRAAADCPYGTVGAQLHRLAESLERGQTLAEGLRQQPGLFPRHYADVVAADEAAGRVEEGLSVLLAEAETGMQRAYVVRNRTAYILLIAAFAIAVGTLIDLRLTPLEEDMGLSGDLLAQNMPTAGRAFMGIFSACRGPATELMQTAMNWYTAFTGRTLDGSTFTFAVVFFSLVLLLIPLVLLTAWLLRRLGRYLLERLPLVRGAMLHTRWSRALRIIALLLERGLPLSDAFQGAASAQRDRSTRRLLERLGARLCTGMELDEALAGEGRRIPPSLRSVVQLGERTGQLPRFLSRLSHLYGMRAERMLRMLGDIVFPLAIGGCGLLVLSIDTRFFTMLSNMVNALVMPGQ